ncbi:MAG: Holliday junction resolvase RuvX [Anaerolineaceae bacterium]|nr:Holliday junction resolvase RuvX [Anaerolineaceae bacterium]
MKGYILGVDPGEKNIGIAISDPTGVLARPLQVIQHISRTMDAGLIAELAREHEVVKIIIGQPLDSEGKIGPQARKSARLAEAIGLQTDTPVLLWDESGSTQIAREARIQMGVRRKDRKGHLDQMAAVVILQSFLDSQSPLLLKEGEDD